jgi:ferredoxin
LRVVQMNPISVDNLSDVIQKKILELHEEPEFQWDPTRTTYNTDDQGNPGIKIAVGNVPLDYDLWKGLRNPAVIGLHPIGLKQIWAYYANIRKERVDESGRQTVFQIPRSFEFAKEKYKRATIVSVMLPFSEKLVQQYIQAIKENPKTSSHRFARMYNDVNMMINKAIVRTAIELVDGDNAVVAMDDNTVEAISKNAVPLTQQGDSHGPEKGGNYPQKSIAALLGLGQFGVSRIVFRDEVEEGSITRYMGPIRSIVIFDKAEPKMNGEDGVIYPSEEWRQFLFELYDFTDPVLNEYRFCGYSPLSDKGCGKCIEICPSGAQANSTPLPTGGYSPEVKEQTHRFYEDKIQFDYGSCCEDRGQLANLYPEWSCARCVTICGSEGLRRPASISNYNEKKKKLLHSS